MARAPVIFVGFEIDESIERALAGCREADRVFIEEPTYLQQAVIDGRRYIGKPLRDNAALDHIEDAARNVASLLTRVAPELRLEGRNIRLIAGEGDGERAAHDDDPAPEPAD